jgi:phosphatidylserine/phosphatidylglycerophosphate/cardiolipin synthase-like enzyme
LAAVLALTLAVLLVGLVAPARRTPPELLLGGPDQELSYARAASRLITGAKQRVWMAMYVMRPEDEAVSGLIDALGEAHDRGVDVRVCLDRGKGWRGEPDDKHLAPAERLQARGITVILDEPDRTTHAKLLVADGLRVLSGSHNWTRSALTANREASWLVEDAAIAAEAERWLASIPGWDAATR